MYTIDGTDILYNGQTCGTIVSFGSETVVRLTHNFPPAFFPTREKAIRFVMAHR